MRLLDHEIALIELIRNEIDKAEKVENKLELLGKLVEFQTKLLDFEQGKRQLEIQDRKNMNDFEQATKALHVQDEKNRDEYTLSKARAVNRN
ncbi:hypothetical protein [uncultured Acinetobacter sp.]|uniref:hypothetical protein n=1 Tax=uncultured Acinetobacter sp. TaxID=165433 RepID=UPI00261A287F|nr:hypothetical protein [uncultured Acinetobacter sp.]